MMYPDKDYARAKEVNSDVENMRKIKVTETNTELQEYYRQLKSLQELARKRGLSRG